MSRDELKAKLDELGIKYDKRWGVKKLTDALPKEKERTEEELKNIHDSISGKDLPTVDEILAPTQRADGNAVTPAGIIIPKEVLVKLKRTKYQFVVHCTQESCSVSKVSPRGKKEFVRVYSERHHGKDFAKLAAQFANKNNK